MKKCDFCTKSAPDGTCFWNNNQIAAETDCDKAIRNMIEAMKYEETQKRTIFGRRTPPPKYL